MKSRSSNAHAGNISSIGHVPSKIDDLIERDISQLVQLCKCLLRIDVVEIVYFAERNKIRGVLKSDAAWIGCLFFKNS